MVDPRMGTRCVGLRIPDLAEDSLPAVEGQGDEAVRIGGRLKGRAVLPDGQGAARSRPYEPFR